MELLFDEISDIFSEWDPLNVFHEIAYDEYKDDFPKIIRSIGNRVVLFECIQDILMNKLGVGFNSKNNEHVRDLEIICDRILERYEECILL